MKDKDQQVKQVSVNSVVFIISEKAEARILRRHLDDIEECGERTDAENVHAAKRIFFSNGNNTGNSVLAKYLILVVFVTLCCCFNSMIKLS